MRNYITGQIDDPPNLDTDEQAKQYIPQTQVAQGLYRVRRKQGDTIEQAMYRTLDTVLQARSGR